MDGDFRQRDQLSPAEAIVETFLPSPRLGPLMAEEEVVHRPWAPTGDEKVYKTIEGPDLLYSPPPPESAGGSIPSAYARFRQYGPDEG